MSVLLPTAQSEAANRTLLYYVYLGVSRGSVGDDSLSALPIQGVGNRFFEYAEWFF